jgi:hypothetical protein
MEEKEMLKRILYHLGKKRKFSSFIAERRESGEDGVLSSVANF